MATQRAGAATAGSGRPAASRPRPRPSRSGRRRGAAAPPRAARRSHATAEQRIVGQSGAVCVSRPESTRRWRAVGPAATAASGPTRHCATTVSRPTRAPAASSAGPTTWRRRPRARRPAAPRGRGDAPSGRLGVRGPGGARPPGQVRQVQVQDHALVETEQVALVHQVEGGCRQRQVVARHPARGECRPQLRQRRERDVHHHRARRRAPASSRRLRRRSRSRRRSSAGCGVPGRRRRTPRTRACPPGSTPARAGGAPSAARSPCPPRSVQGRGLRPGSSAGRS